MVDCFSTGFKYRISCQARHIRFGRDVNCSEPGDAYRTGQRFIIENLTVADLGVYQCSTVGRSNPVTSTTFTITAGKSGAQVFEFIMSPNYGPVPFALCPLSCTLCPVHETVS